jgi:hypothetical protein
MFFSVYRVFQEECKKLQESVPYVKLYRYNPKHLYPNLNGYGDNGHRKVWFSLRFHALYLFSDTLHVMHMLDLDTAHASGIAVKLTSALQTASYL